MNGAVENRSLLVGVPVLQFVRRGSRAGGRWQKQQQRRSRGIPRCQWREGWNPVPEKDTRIHWSSPDEGWLGTEEPSSSPGSSSTSLLEELLSTFDSPLDSHYAFLGVRPDVDSEGIKTAYRKLSKLYHPDTTSLPADEAAKNFFKLQKAYDVLSSTEERKIYDWTLAQQISSQQGGGFVWPYEAAETLQGPGFETKVIAKATGDSEYIDFSPQMMAGLFFDGFAFVFSLMVIFYVAFFKHH
ncbi:hypothetical protein GOP47_0023625 [Adiantum capillus-veneris]|uniref:J domain-containing protein n=1 Tax=Adiantum capillus-veneris TaxID=13818 RepID=A0A9D4Z4Q4_ADICA|nr:hypothetical protein GOP47_0023625 [Adiantum capillus-veneris]